MCHPLPHVFVIMFMPKTVSQCRCPNILHVVQLGRKDFALFSHMQYNLAPNNNLKYWNKFQQTILPKCWYVEVIRQMKSWVPNRWRKPQNDRNVRAGRKDLHDLDKTRINTQRAQCYGDSRMQQFHHTRLSIALRWLERNTTVRVCVDGKNGWLWHCSWTLFFHRNCYEY